MVQSDLEWYIGQCELRRLNMVQRVLRRYIGQCELRSLNMVQSILRWYIGQCEAEKKAFEHFPIGSNVNLCPAVVAILDFRPA